MAKRHRRSTKARSTGGVLPGEYRRKSLVVVTRDTFRPGASDAIGRETQQYIVGTVFHDGAYNHEVTYVEGNVKLLIPGKVAEAIIRHRKGIGEARKSDKARERAVSDAQGIVKGATP